MGKHWWFKYWRMDDFSPNSPMFEPSKVSLHMVTDSKYENVAIANNLIHIVLASG